MIWHGYNAYLDNKIQWGLEVTQYQILKTVIKSLTHSNIVSNVTDTKQCCNLIHACNLENFLEP